MAKKINKVETPKQIEPQIRLHGIELISSSFSQQPNLGTLNNFNFSISTENKIDFDRKLVIVFVKIDIKPFDEISQTLASFHAGIGVEILNFDEVVDRNNVKDNLIVLPPEFETILRTIAISTMRGIMFSELRGTYLHSATLPIIITQLPSSQTKN